MKRTFEEMTEGQEENQVLEKAEVEPILYGPSWKRRKMDEQLVGDYIVKALDSVHFKIGKCRFKLIFCIVSDIGQLNDENSADFFAPKFLHWIFGEKEEIRGYEGL